MSGSCLIIEDRHAYTVHNLQCWGYMAVSTGKNPYQYQLLVQVKWLGLH